MLSKRPSLFGAKAVLFLGALSLGGFVYAAPAYNKENQKIGKTCFLNKAEALRKASIMGGKMFGSQQLLLTPAPKVLVVRIQFSDASFSHSAAESVAFFDRVRAYYEENSYGVFRPTFTVSSFVHTLGSMSTYGSDCGSDVACHDAALIQAAVNAENTAGRDFSAFDHLMLYHAGNGQETSNTATDIWSVYFPTTFSVDAKSFTGMTIVPESEAQNVDALGVICHEYGHQLGLPDLYDTGSFGGSSTVGAWDIMDYPYAAAPDGQEGANPPHFGAWSKRFLGFLSPTQLSASGSKSLYSVDVTSGAVFELPVNVSSVGSQESFLVEYRNQSSTATYDKSTPASGILIWHIDESISSSATHLLNNDVNSPSSNGAGHRGVDLVEADMTEKYVGAARGEAGDAFTAASVFLPPLSDAFNGISTGLFLSNIDGIGTTQATFDLETPALSTASVAGVALSTTISAGGALIGLSAPAGTFSSGVFYTAALSSSLLGELGSLSYAASLEGTGVGFLAGVSGNQTPRNDVAVSVDATASAALTALPEEEFRRLTLARFVAGTNAWVPVETSASFASKTLSANLDHFSLFQIMKTGLSSSVSQVKIFPNPMRPSRGPTYAVVNFSNLTPNARVKIFSLRGELLKEMQANASGLAVWDGKDESGDFVASGVYLSMLEKDDGGEKAVRKFAIER